MLSTDCILRLDKIKNVDLFISVMRLHTHNDGKTPREDINFKKINIHLQLLSPSLKLLGDYYKRDLPWNDYEERFRAEINNNPRALYILKNLAREALTKNIVFLCIEEKPNFCHRKLLAQICKEFQPNLEVIIK